LYEEKMASNEPLSRLRSMDDAVRVDPFAEGALAEVRQVLGARRPGPASAGQQPRG
jgi:hypothetical protein